MDWEPQSLVSLRLLKIMLFRELIYQRSEVRQPLYVGPIEKNAVFRNV